MKWHRESKIAGWFFLALVLLAVLRYEANESSTKVIEASDQTMAAEINLRELGVVLSAVQDAETGQRGYLLTGDKQYLLPYQAAADSITGHVQALRNASGASQKAQVDAISAAISQKFKELQGTIALYDAGKRDEAWVAVKAGRGKRTMDQIRAMVQGLRDADRTALEGITAKGKGTQTGPIDLCPADNDRFCRADGRVRGTVSLHRGAAAVRADDQRAARLQQGDHHQRGGGVIHTG